MRPMHLYINKILIITILLWVISLGSFVYATEQQDYNDAKTRLDGIRNPVSAWIPAAPINKDQKWSIANILSRLFDGTWKIRSIFIAAFDNLTPWAIPSWTGTGFSDSIIGQSGSIINIEWNINIEWEIVIDNIAFNWWRWTEWVGEIYYNGWNVGVWVASPDSTLHVGGDIKIGDSTDTCDGVKSWTLRFNNGYIQLCADN